MRKLAEILPYIHTSKFRATSQSLLRLKPQIKKLIILILLVVNLVTY